MLASGVQQSDSVIYQYTHIYIFFFRFFSHIGYYKILNIVPCAIPIPVFLSSPGTAMARALCKHQVSASGHRKGLLSTHAIILGLLHGLTGHHLLHDFCGKIHLKGKPEFRIQPV